VVVSGPDAGSHRRGALGAVSVLFIGFLSQGSLKRKTPQARPHLPYLPWSNDALRLTGTQGSYPQVLRKLWVNPEIVGFDGHVERLQHFIVCAAFEQVDTDAAQLALDPRCRFGFVDILEAWASPAFRDQGLRSVTRGRCAIASFSNSSKTKTHSFTTEPQGLAPVPPTTRSVTPADRSRRPLNDLTPLLFVVWKPRPWSSSTNRRLPSVGACSISDQNL
jgi:hypothetical protein